jgi:cytochrome b-561
MLRGLTSGALDFLHTIITLMTSIFLFAGIYVAVITVNSSENLHFYTIHSWIGLASIIGFVLQWIAGFVIFIFPKFIPSIQKLLIPIHTYLGRTVFALIGCTAILGISDKLRFNDL